MLENSLTKGQITEVVLTQESEKESGENRAVMTTNMTGNNNDIY